MINILDFDSICNTAASLQTIYMIKNAFYLIRVVVPIVLIIMAMLDVIKMITASNPDQIMQGGRIVRRMFAAVAVFFVLLIVDTTLNVLGKANFSSSQCWNDATKQMVDAKYKAEELERKALDDYRKQSLESQKDKKSEREIEYNNIGENTKVDENTEGLSDRAKLIEFAKKYVGNRYVFGGNDLNNGIDCSGFVQQAYAHIGISLPRTTYDQCEKGTKIDGVENAKLGDIFCYYDNSGAFGHVTLYAGVLSNGEGESSGVSDGTKAVVHASNSQPFPSGGIKFSNVNYRTPGRIVRIIK